MSNGRWSNDEVLACIKVSRLPVQVCWHIGTLKIEDRGWGSHEGSCLSVSVDPIAWRSIAGLDGPLNQFKKPGATFVDAHTCLRVKPLMREILTWGTRERYVVRKQVYRIAWFDSEREKWSHFTFLDEQQAKREFRSFREEELDQVRYSSFVGYVPTARMTERMRHTTLPLAFVRDFALMIFVDEQVPEADGVWWRDHYDPAGLSAPRGAIFERQIPSWSSTLVPSSHPDTPSQ